jgi:hypothetical protein
MRSWLIGALLGASFGCGGIDLASETRGDAGEGDGKGAGASGTTGGTGTGGASGTTGPTGAGGSSSGGSAGTGGSAGVAGGIPDGGVCKRTFDRAVIRVTRPGGSILECDKVLMGIDSGTPNVMTGRVTTRTDSSFTIDSCPPNADCPADTLLKVEVLAPDFVMPPLGPLVRVQYSMERFYACQQSLEVTNVQRWDGMVTPGILGETLALAVTDGGGPFNNSPYTVERVGLGCEVDAGRGCGGGGQPPGDYAFLFSWKGDPQTRTRVEMGDTRPFDPPSAAMVTVSARNLRSYQTEACDDYWNYAYYLVAQPITP